jgi:predicted porin
LTTAAFGAAAQASSSSVNIFGVIDVGAGRYQLAGRPSSNDVVASPLITSRLGFMGSEDLGGGLRANFFVTHMMRPDTGEAGRFPGDVFWSSRATVGLSGAFGQLNLGRMNSPLFFTLLRFDPHELAPLAPTFMQTYPGGQPLAAPMAVPDSAINNGIQYASPVMAGFSASIHAGTAEVPGTHKGRFGYSANYTNKALSVGIAGEALSAPIVAGETRQNALAGAVSYDLQAVKVAAIYQRHEQKTLGNKYSVASIGATVPIGIHKIIASWARTDLDQATGVDPHRTGFALTYDHMLSKRTDVYVHALKDRLSTASSDGNTLLGGIRHRF